MNYGWSPWSRIDNFGYNSFNELKTSIANDLRIYEASMTKNKTVELPIPKPGYGGSKAYIYIASGFSSDEMENSFEFGVIRIGYSNDGVEKTIICNGGQISFGCDFSVSDGKIYLYCGSASVYNLIKFLG